MHDYLLWEEHEPRLSIMLRRDVLEDLKEVATQAFSGTGAEAGGVLVGRSEDMVETGQRVITVEKLETDVSGLHAGSVVGFVRLRKQKVLHLLEEDFLTRSGVGLVCLMVRPDGKGGAIGGFFYREGKTVRCPSAAMQFAIDRAAADCVAGTGQETCATADTGQETSATSRRIFYGAVGVALMVASFAIWLVGR